MNLKILSMKKMTIFLAFLLFVGFQAAAQMQITGTVTSAEDGSPIPGVSVVVKDNATIGTATDIDGKYSLTVPGSAEALIYSAVGMKTQEQPIAGRTVIDVTLEAEVLQMDEVIVTAIGIRREAKALGFAASTFGEEDITKTRQANLVEGLQAKVPGVQISGTSGEPGSSMTVAIRGHSSINGNEPLYVIDGVPISNVRLGSGDELNGGYDMGNGLNAVNPDDIENMTILKGAAATALYGSQASAGAVIITTKGGSKSDGFGINYNGTYGVSQVLRTPTFQNEFGQGWDGQHLLIENGSWGPRFDGEERVYMHVVDGERKVKPYVAQEDNYKDFWDFGQNQTHSLSINGSDEKTSYFFSYSYADQDGIYPTDADSYNRHTFSLRGTRNIEKLSISTSINYSNEEINSVPTGQGLTVVNNLMQIPRGYSIVDMEDYNDPFYNIDNYYTPYGITNPYYSLGEYGRLGKKNKIYGKLQLDYEITDWMNFTYRFGGDVNALSSKSYNPITIPAEGSPNYNSSTSDLGRVAEQQYQRIQTNHDFLFNIDKQLSTDFRFVSTLGYNIFQYNTNNLTASVDGLDIPYFYNLSNSASDPVVGQRSTQKRMLGLYGQFEISYKNLLYVTATARNDWSSALPKENNTYFYPSATVSFIASEILPDNIKDIVSFAKIRASYGQAGNDANPYLIDPVFIQSSVFNPFRNLNFPLSGINAFEVSNILGNKDLQPEITTEMEIGGEFRFYQNRFGFDFSYFDKDVEDQILALTIPSTTGYTRQTMNLGSINTKGFELGANITPVRNDDWNWTIGFIYNKYETMVEELHPSLEEVQIGGFAGVGIFAKVGEPMGVLMTTPLAETDDGQVIVDASGYPKSAADPEVIGKAEYDFTAGVTNSLSYKGINLSFTIDIRQGGVFYSRTKDILYFTGNSIETTYNDRQPFIVPNSVVEVVDVDGNVVGYEENTIPVDRAHMDDFYNNGGLRAGENPIIDKSFVKLRNLSLSYNLPSKLIDKLPLKGASISLIGTNLLLWTPEDNSFVDPEISTFGNDIAGMFGEFSGTPSTRTFSISLGLKL